MNRPKINIKKRLDRKRWKRWLKFALIAALGFMLISLIFNITVRYPANVNRRPDAILVLGGSIRREIYAAALANSDPDLPILISQGSKDPCIFLLFDRVKAPKSKVLLEKCANSTFDNFFFAVPILKFWGARKVKVITSESHLPRAEILANIHLRSHGMAVEMDIVKESGIPGNNESPWKTRLDIARSLIWAYFGQLLYPPCWSLTPLSSVDVNAWRAIGFECEAQGKVR